MNLRSFCRETGYPRAIALTYSFDPIFFERIILRDLWHGGTGDITIVGDRQELQDAVTRYAGQINFLGQKYLLSMANNSGRFHPKILLRVGPKGARLLLGTGNLTFYGWGGNKELGFDLRLDSSDPASSEIVNRIVEYITPYLSSDSARDAIARLIDYPWLTNRDETFDHSLLMTAPDASLTSQLQLRWAGRKFDKLTIFTGSTDENGAFIEWCYSQFGIKECIVAVSPENSSFIQKEIDRLPVKVSLAPFTGSQRLHAKFYWFEGENGPAAIVGSANCSRAAWLKRPSDGGNVEAIQIFDVPAREDFEKILELLPQERVSVSKAVPDKPEEGDLDKQPPYQIRSIFLQRTLEFIEVKFNHVPTNTSSINLNMPGGSVIPLQPRTDDTWRGVLTETMPWPEGTTLAKAELLIDGVSFETPLHWIDDLDAINKASQVKQIMSSFGGLVRSRTSSEHEKVVSDLAMIKSSLFTENAVFADPQLHRKRIEAGEDQQQESEPVKPEDLVRSLNDLEIKDTGPNISTGHGLNLNLFGIMRALFDEADAPNDASIVDAEAQTTKEGEVPQEDNGKNAEPPKDVNAHQEPPAAKYRQRLLAELDDFMQKFSSQKFADECTATKLVQAAAFPLAVSLLGEKGQWLTHDEARMMVTKTVDILLNRLRPGSQSLGLIEEVGKKFKDKEQYDVFLQVVGDGTLWIALLAGLSHYQCEEDRQRFERAISLSRIYFCDELRSDTSIGRLGSLISRFQVERARDLISKDAPKIVTALWELEDTLHKRFDEFIGLQSGERAQPGDQVWHPVLGWGYVEEFIPPNKLVAYLHARGTAVKVLSQSYLNLRIASGKELHIKELIDRIA